MELMTRLAGKNGWFVPVGELLDFLLTQSKNRELTPAQRAKLERRWLMHKIRIGGTS